MFRAGMTMEQIAKELHHTGKTIHAIISAEGYKRSVASLRMFVQKERCRNEDSHSSSDACSDYQPKEYIQRKSLTQLIYSKIDDIYSISREQFKKALETHPMLATVYKLRNDFGEIIYSKIQMACKDGYANFVI